MGATHIVRTVVDGRVVEVPVDADTDEGRALLAAEGQRPSGAVVELDERGRQELARRQYVENVAQSVEDSGPLVRGLSGLASGAIGVADATTAGLDRVVLRMLGDREAARLEGFTQATETENTIGRVGGDLGWALATGGASLGEAGMARASAAGLQAAFGNSVRRALLRRLVPRLGQRGATIAASGLAAAAEGGLAGVTEAITQSNISDTPLSGEQMLSNGLFGAGLGLGLGSLGGAVESRFLRAAGPAGEEAVTRLEEAGLAARIPEGEPNPFRGLQNADPAQNLSWFRRQLARSPVFATDEMQAAFERLASAPDRVMAAVHGFARSARAHASDLSSLFSEVETAGARILNTETRQAAMRTAAEAAAEADLAGARTAIGEARDSIDGLLAGTTVPAADRSIYSGLRSSLNRLLDSSAGDTAAGLDRVLEDLRRTARDATSREQLTALRAQLGTAGDRLSPEFSEMRRLRDLYRDRVDELGRHFGRTNVEGDFDFAGPAVANQLGDSAYLVRGDSVQYLDQWYDAADQILRASPGSAAARRRLAQTAVGSEDLLVMGRDAAAVNMLQSAETSGAGIQAAVGNKAVAMLGTAIGAGGVMSGNPLLAALGIGMAVGGHPVGTVQLIQGMTRMVRGSEGRMARASGRLRSALTSPALERGARAASLGGRQVPRVVLDLRSPRERDRTYDEIVRQVRAYASDPSLLEERVAAMTEGLGGVAPETAGGFAQGAVAGLYHLAENLPPAAQPSPFPGRPERRASTGEREDLVRRYEAIENPYGVMEWAADGRLTAAHVDAVRATYPRLYQAIQAEVTNIIGSLERLPPYQMRTRLGLLLGVPVDPSLDPRFIFSMQQTFAQSAAQNEAQLGRGPTATMSMRVSDDTMTRAASVTHRI